MRARTPPQAAHRKSGALAVAYLLFAGVLYGLLFSINKVATTNGVPGLAYVFWHTLGAGLLLWLGCLATRTPIGLDRSASAPLLRRRRARHLDSRCPLLAHVAPKLPASLVVMVTCLSPTCTYLMAMTLRLERFRWLSTGGVALGPRRNSDPGGAWHHPSDLRRGKLAAAGDAGAGLLRLLQRRQARSCGRPRRIRWGWPAVFRWAEQSCWFPSCWARARPISSPAPCWQATSRSWARRGSPPWSGILIFEILRLGGPLFLSQFGYIVVLTGFGWGAVIFGERLSGSAWIAAALLLAGLAVLTWSKRLRPRG